MELNAMMSAHADRVPDQLASMIQQDSDEKKEYDWKKMQNIRVIARFRPSNRIEKDYSRKRGIRDHPPDINNNIITLTTVDEKQSHNRAASITSRRKKQDRMKYRSVLDHVFHKNTNQKEVFKITGQPLIHAALNGFNATLFAYGQTGSGKTYSMFGANDDGSGTDLQAMGLIPRSFVYLFDQLEQRCNNQTIQNFSVSMQTLQIYNKRLLDLLNPNSKTKLAVKTDFTTDSIFVKHLRTMQITSAREALAVLIESSKNRIVASHALNQHSSRSHMLVLLKIRQIKIDGSSTRSNINFGDLAGSENIAKAHGKSSKGKNDEEKARDAQSRQEGIAINSSLSALTRCINSLVKGEHPGYRDSPLTHVLQDSLGGNSKTTLLVCASPHIFNRNETIRTFRFAATAKQVKNKAKINQTLSVKALQKRIKELTAENAQLKSELAIARGKLKNSAGRRSIVGIADSVIDAQQQPQLFAQYSSAPSSKANITLTYQTARLLGADNLFGPNNDNNRNRSSSIQSIHGNSSDDIISRSPSNSFAAALESTGDINALQAAVSVAEQAMVVESEEYMRQIANLNQQLQQEVTNTKELSEKTERQNLELDKAESTINHLRSENDDKVVKLYNCENKVEELEKQLLKLKFFVGDYKQMFPDYKPKKYIPTDSLDMSSDIDRAGSDIDDNNLNVPDGGKHPNKDSMDIQVESLEKFMSAMGHTQTDLTEFTDKISSHVNVLPEMRAEFTEKYQKTTEFYGDITKKTKDLQSQISSMRFILENLAKNYDEDRDKKIGFENNESIRINSDVEVGNYNSEDSDDDDDDYDRDLYIGDSIIESKQSCWSKIFYCGGDEDRQIKRDIRNDNRYNDNRRHRRVGSRSRKKSNNKKRNKYSSRFRNIEI